MKLENFLPILLISNVAMAGGGGGVIIFFLFFPVIIWVLIKIWKFWFAILFGGKKEVNVSNFIPNNLAQRPTKDCPFCAEPILIEAKKCKHCGSNLS